VLTFALSLVTGLLCLSIAKEVSISESLLFQVVLWTAVGSIPLRVSFILVERKWRQLEEDCLTAEAEAEAAEAAADEFSKTTTHGAVVKARPGPAENPLSVSQLTDITAAAVSADAIMDDSE